MDLLNVIRRKSLPLLTIIVITSSLIGCATTRPIVFNPIEKNDIFDIPKGAKIVIPAGTQVKNERGEVVAQWPTETTLTVEKNGRFLSDIFFDKVINATVKNQ